MEHASRFCAIGGKKMNDGLFEDYGEAILYVAMAWMVFGVMAVVLEAFTAC